eukprot:31385-Pelagococcus_subviridis.AAC.1
MLSVRADRAHERRDGAEVGRRGVDIHRVQGHDDNMLGREGREGGAAVERARALGEHARVVQRVRDAHRRVRSQGDRARER